MIMIMIIIKFDFPIASVTYDLTGAERQSVQLQTVRKYPFYSSLASAETTTTIFIHYLHQVFIGVG